VRTLETKWLWIGLAIGLPLLPRFGEGWRWRTRLAPEFIVSTNTISSARTETPARFEEFVDPEYRTPSVHVASLCELPGGGLAAAWYGGSREGARDVAIYLATRATEPGSRWTAPRAIVTPDSAVREAWRFVKKVGNPLLFADAQGRLSLLYVTVAVGGWSGSSLNLKQSSDGGRTWTPSRRLGLSPFFNVSELVKNKPAALAGGGWAVPMYHELFGKFPEVLWLDDTAVSKVAKTRVFGGRSAFQPALVPLSAERALMFCRACGSTPQVHLTETSDGGRRWSAPRATGLPNPDSGLDAIRLTDGRLLLAFNDSTNHRENLRLAMSSDEGKSWQRVATLAEETGAEFSYPSLLQARDGQVHVVYTWKRRGIKHVTFNLAWLAGQRREATAKADQLRPERGVHAASATKLAPQAGPVETRVGERGSGVNAALQALTAGRN
jgi:predicted neuraminidase